MNGFFFFTDAIDKTLWRSVPYDVWFVRTDNKEITREVLSRIIKIGNLEDTQLLRATIVYTKRDGKCKQIEKDRFEFEYEDSRGGICGISGIWLGDDKRKFVIDIR